jgi:hypothetical protein
MNTLFDPNTTPQLDPNKNYLEELVGEGKKFKTIEDLARGKYESDVYIDTLTRKQDEINKDYRRVLEESKTQATLKDMIAQMQTQYQQPHLEPQNTPPVNDKPVIDRDELRSLISNEIVETQRQRKEQENFSTVQKKLTEQFGPNYQEVLKRQMDTLELSAEDIDRLAKKSPTAFFNTLGLNQQPIKTNIAPPRTQRNDTFLPAAGKKRDYQYYQELKKSNPMLYIDPKITVQMQNDVIEMGEEAFYGPYL